MAVVLLAVLGSVASASLQRGAATLFVPPFDTSSYDFGPLEALIDDGNTGAVAFWRTDDSNVYLGLAATAWWVGFGINPHGPSMAGADIIICREHQEGIVSVVDYHADRYGAPEMDELQDWHTLRGGRQPVSFPAGPGGACEQGWSWGGTACYWVSSEGASWDGAQRRCGQMGGTLAKVASEAQNSLVRSLAPNGSSQIWLGAKLNRQSGNFEWQDGTGITYGNYYQGWPQGDGRCTYMGSLGNDDGQWANVDCRWTKPRIACMKPAEAGLPTIPPQDQRSNPLVTWCEAKRSRRTCENDKDVQLTDLSISMHSLFAWTPSWQRRDAAPAYHGNDRRRSLPLTFAGSKAAPSPTDALSFTLEAPVHEVSLEGGSYACSYHMLPIQASTRYQIIWYKLEQSGPAKAAGLQHHVDLNACSGAVHGMADGQAADCDFLMGSCWKTLLNQAGMYMPQGMSTPPDAGIPIGHEALQYVVMSRHFYNPAEKPGILDMGTKFHIHYTSALRANDMSQITLGTQQFIVPAQTFGQPVTAWCPSDCTQRLGQVQVTNVAFHMHGYGQSTRVRVVRDGVELEPMAVLKPFDQSLANIAISRWLQPGDTVLLECVYNNDLTTELKYGDAIGNEMCFSFLTLVGQSSMSLCLDYPWGGFNCEQPDSPQCTGQTSKGYCPDRDHKQGSAVVHTHQERNTAFTPYVDSSRAECEASRMFEVVPAIPGKCRASSPTMTGSKSCNLGSIVDFRVEWTADCNKQTVQFEVSASIGSGGWLGIGLHDAGTALAPVPLGTRMNGADIVQVNPSSGAVRDGLGVGYTAPRAKRAAITTVDEWGIAGGRSRVKFTRPLASSEGITLSEDRFAWLVCAYKRGSTDFDVKHSEASALTEARVSFFGGIAESKRYAPQVPVEPNQTTSALAMTATAPARTSTGSPQLIGPCSSALQPFRGSQDCGFGSSIDFRLDWVVDCSTQIAEFTMSAQLGTAGWLGVGFHDAGTASDPLFMTSPMQGPDIVQASPATGAFRDAMGSGYTAPRAKDVPVAKLVSQQLAGGRASAIFRRPFVGAQGLDLRDDRLVRLICAYSRGSNDLDSKHQHATSVSGGAVSLFRSTPTTATTTATLTTTAPDPTVTSTPRAQLHVVKLDNISYTDVCANQVALCRNLWKDIIAQSLSTLASSSITADQVRITRMRQGSMIVEFTLASEVPYMETGSIVGAINQKIPTYTPSPGVQMIREIVEAMSATQLTQVAAAVTKTTTPTTTTTAATTSGAGITLGQGVSTDLLDLSSGSHNHPGKLLATVAAPFLHFLITAAIPSMAR